MKTNTRFSVCFAGSLMRSISVSALERICLGTPWNFIFYEIVRKAGFTISSTHLCPLLVLSTSSHLIVPTSVFVQIFQVITSFLWQSFLFSNTTVLTFSTPSSTLVCSTNLKSSEQSLVSMKFHNNAVLKAKVHIHWLDGWVEERL
jgi:hypothetical protein